MFSPLPTRLASHGLDQFRFSTPSEVVEHYGCIQAQDIGQAKWVIGSRIQDSTEKMIREACRRWDIVRTWPMRGTLHYMNPRHVKWMLSLCASKTLPHFTRYRNYLWISDQDTEMSLKVIEQNLTGWHALTRKELKKILIENGIPIEWTNLLSHYAATRWLICFWPPTDKEETFVLLDEWVKDSAVLSHEKQLAELARMYIRGHGGATVDDLAWWCGLGKTECKTGFALIESELEKVEYNGKIYYHFPHSTAQPVPPSVQFLGWFDEYFLGYKDRSIVADSEHYRKLLTTNGIFFPLILQDGKVVGTWKRAWKKDTVVFTIEILPWYAVELKALEQEAMRYSNFSGYNKYQILWL